MIVSACLYAGLYCGSPIFEAVRFRRKVTTDKAFMCN